MTASPTSVSDTLKSLPRLLAAGRFDAARDSVDSALRHAPDHPGLNAFAAFICDRLDQRDAAINHAQKAAAAGAQHPRPTAQAANLLARFRRFDEALRAARSIAPDSIRDPVVADQLGAAFTACEAHDEAEQAYARLVALVPPDPRCRFNLAAAQRFNGKRDAAAANFDTVIAAHPGHGEAWYARALVKPATETDNRIGKLSPLADDPRLPATERAAICYALGKENEDIGQWRAAFEAWSRGAAAIRQSRPYDVAPECAAMTETAKHWPRAQRQPAGADCVPVFIVSLPRAGSTLIDRILSSHPAVVSAGETEDFILSLLADPALAAEPDPVARARRTADIDMEAVGARYREALARRGHRTGHVIDKTPTNFLYAGLIAEALPEARIIHVDRDPVDAALATFKTLFRDRYLWSYDLDDTADYILAKQALMAHWEAGWPDRIRRVTYEETVRETEATARRLLEFLELDWDPACLDFTRNRASVSTASADQVRQPVHDRSIGHWRHFEAEMATIAEKLSASA